MTFLSKIKRIVKKIGKRVEKSVVKAMSRTHPRFMGQARGQQWGAGRGDGGQERKPGGAGRGAGGAGGGRGPVEELTKRMEELGGFSKDDDGNTTVHIVSNNFQVRCEAGGAAGGAEAEGAAGGAAALANEFVVHQFRVQFEMELGIAVKKSILKVCQESFFGGAYLHDGGELLYCTNLFSKEKVTLEPEVVREGVAEKHTLVFDYIKTLSQHDPVSMQIYNLIVRQCMYGIGLDPLGDNFYDSSAVINYAHLKLQLWPGYLATVKPSEQGLLLCVDVLHKVVHSQDLLTHIHGLREAHTKRRISTSLDEYMLDQLKGFMIITPHNKLSYRIDGIRADLTPLSTFPVKGKNGQLEDITFVDYYKKRHNIAITIMNQPLVVSNVKQKFQGKKTISEVILVPELCLLTGLSEEMRANMGVMRDLGKHLHLGPAERVDMIQKFMERLVNSEQARKTLTSWGLSFEPKLAPCVPAKVFPKVSIGFGNNKTFKADEKNDWTRAIRDNKMLVSIPLKKWIVVCGERDQKQTKDFVEIMRKVAGPLGFQILPPMRFDVLRDTRVIHYVRALEDLAGEEDMQMVLCVLPTNGAELYNAIKKRLSREIGIPSQCIVSKTMMKNMMSVATKVVIQINTKLGGEPWMVKLPKQFQESSMAIGFDFTGKGLRTGVLVATTNSQYTRYYSTTFQFREPAEMSLLLKTSINNIIKAYQELNRSPPPSSVVFYRNNVEDGKINSGEIERDAALMLEGLREWREHQSVEGDVHLVYMTLAKRSSTRLMSHTGDCSDGIVPRQVVNPPPGTVADKGIVTSDPRYKEFFMVPTVARQGTVRSVHYRVILDTKGLPPAVLEAFTYKLCHLYYNWTGTVNLPSVIQYATKLGRQATQAIPNARPHPCMSTLLHFL